MKKILSYLVENAFDFLARAINEFKCSPKYSVIHFSTSVELFLKARLVSEHWSLVVVKQQSVNLQQFKAGSFQSVTIKEATNKLENIVCSKLSNQTIDAFQKVADHRNKIIHCKVTSV